MAYRATLQQRVVSTNKIVTETQNRIEKLKQILKGKLRALQPQKATFDQLKQEFIQMLDSGGEAQVLATILESPITMQGTIDSLEARIADFMRQVKKNGGKIN